MISTLVLVNTLAPSTYPSKEAALPPRDGDLNGGSFHHSIGTLQYTLLILHGGNEAHIWQNREAGRNMPYTRALVMCSFIRDANKITHVRGDRYPSGVVKTIYKSRQRSPPESEEFKRPVLAAIFPTLHFVQRHPIADLFWDQCRANSAYAVWRLFCPVNTAL